MKEYAIPSKKPPMSTYIVAFVVSDLKNVSIHYGKNTVVARGCFVSSQICLIHCTGHNHVTGELHRNNICGSKVGSGGCTKPTIFGYGELGYCYVEVSNDTYIIVY